MNNTTADIIKEIAEQLDCGFSAFIHKETGQILFVPDENNLPQMELDLWDEELEQLQNNLSDYYEIDKWTSNEAFATMKAFADQVPNHNLQGRLLDALKKNKPFSAFKFVIDNSGDYRQQWFDFKSKWQQDFVARQLNRLKPSDE